MMEKRESRLLTALSFVHTVLLLAGFYLLTAAARSLGHGEALRYLAGSLWLFLPVAVSWLCIRRVRNFFLYHLAGIGTGGALWLISGDPLTVFLSELVFLIRCYVWIARAKNKKARQEMMGDPEGNPVPELWQIPTLLDWPRMGHLAVQVVLYLAFLVMRRTDLFRPMFWLLFAEILVVFVYNYLDSQRDFIRANQRIANLPVSTMRRNRQAILAIAGLLLAVFLLPSVLCHYEPLTKLYERKLHLNIQFETEEQWQEAPGGDPMAEMLESLAGEEPRELPRWVQNLMTGFAYGMCACVAAALLWAVYKACRRMVESFAGDGEEDELIFTEEVPDRYERARRGRGRERWNSPSRVIRRRYKKTLKARMKASPEGWESPQELEGQAGLSGSGEFHDLYEKARYSEAGCTQEEAERYKGLSL